MGILDAIDYNDICKEFSFLEKLSAHVLEIPSSPLWLKLYQQMLIL